MKKICEKFNPVNQSFNNKKKFVLTFFYVLFVLY
jgi:hypothetical protein